MSVKHVRFPLVGLVVSLTLVAGLSAGVPEEAQAFGESRALASGLIKAGSVKPLLPDESWLPAGSWFEGKGWPAEAGMQAGLAGSVPGGCEVDSSGKLRCSIAMEEPGGRAGMTPELSLVYSGGGNGPLGVGWSVSGAMSVITRCGKSFAVEGFVGGVHYQDGLLDKGEESSDRFCLDGQKLLEVKGGYGQEEYRTVAESFAQIRAYGSSPGVAPQRFVVKSRGGTISTYVAITGVRYEATASGLNKMGEPPVLWALDTVEDVSGNFIRYEYDVIRDTQYLSGSEVLSPVISLEVAPKRIRYTGNNKAEAPTDIRTPQREIEFVYREQPRTDSQELWFAGIKSRQTKLLEAIRMKAPNPNGGSAKQETVWTYRFAYTTSQHSGRTLLASVERCALDGNLIKGGGCFWKKKLDWYQTPALPTFEVTSLPTMRAGAAGLVVAMPGPASLSYDFNIKDFGGNYEYAAIGHADLVPYLHLGDMDGNGMDDAITQLSGTLHWQWPEASEDGIPEPPPPSEPVSWQLLYRGQRMMNNQVFPLKLHQWVLAQGAGTGQIPRTASSVMDLNGDGQAEWWMLRVFNDSVTKKWMCEQVQTRWEEASQLFIKVNSLPAYECKLPEAPFTHLFMDADGDNRPELLTTQPRWVTSPNDPSKMKWLPGTWEAHQLRRAAINNDMVPMSQGDTGVVAGCAIRLVDLDGDGKTELLTKPWREDLAQWKFGCDPTKTLVLSQQEGLVQGKPTYVVKEDTKGKYPPLSQGTITDWESGKTDLDVTTQFFDFNSDGLSDAWDVSHPPQLAVRINTGNGFLPPVSVSGFPQWGGQGNSNSLCEAFGQAPGCLLDQISGRDEGQVESDSGFRIMDMNGDGRLDVVVLERLPVDPVTKAHRGKVHVMVSRGNGTFTKTTLTDTPALSEMAGLWFPRAGFTTFGVGDFNGDGRIDVLSGADRSTCDAQPNGKGCKVNRKYELQLYTQTTTDAANPIGVADVLKGWRDGDRWLSLEVKYDTRWADKWSGGTGSCGLDKTCLRRGFPVVREFLIRDDAVDVANGVIPSPKVFKLSYEAPTGSVQRGFLGFKKVRVFEPLRPMETVKEYEFDSAVDIGSSGRYEPLFPYADQPKRVTTTVPYKATANKQSMIARVTRSETVTTEVRQLTQANGKKTWLLLPRESRTQEWEQTVSLDPNLVSPNNPGLDRLWGVQTNPSLVLRQVDYLREDDNWGNTIFSQSSVKNGATTTVESTYYPADETNWVMGLVENTRMSTTQAGPQALMAQNEVRYTYTSKAQVKTIEREPQSSDPYVKLTVANTYDPWGNLISQAVYGTNSEGKLEIRRSNVEYDALLPGQPDERLYPSQTWLSDNPAFSSWTAIHPAFAVPIAIEDALGNYVQYKYDVAGRLVWTKGKIGGVSTQSYAGRPDCKDGNNVSHCFNGMIVTSQQFDANAALQSTTKSVTDGVGRALTQQGTTFDGGIAETKLKYDSLGRVIKASRPYTPGQAPIFDLTEYDPLNRVIRYQDPSQVGTSVGTTYGYVASTDPAKTLTTTVTDPEGNQKASVVDVDGRLVKSIEYLKTGNTTQPLVTQYRYGARGLEHTIDPKGNQDETRYNQLGQPIYYQAVGTGSTEAGWDSFGSARYMEHENKEKVSFFYDTFGRLKKRTVMDGTGQSVFQAEFTWDSASLGQLASTRAINGLAPVAEIVETSYGYDIYGRPASSKLTLDGQSYTHQMGYNANGQLQSLQFPGPNGQASLQACYSYNPQGALTTVKQVDPGAACTGSGQPLWKVNFRNVEGALLQGELGNGVNVSRSYDPLTGRLLNLLAGTLSNVKPLPPPLMDLRYGYYHNGLVKLRQDYANRDANNTLQPRLEEFKYEDGLLRLTQANLVYGGELRKTDYSYDELGNQLGKTLTQSVLGQPPGVAKPVETRVFGLAGQPHAPSHYQNHLTGELIDYAYDKQGRQTQSTSPGANGPPVINRILDYRNGSLLPRTVSVREGAQMLTYTMTYDAFGQRVKKTGKYGKVISMGGVERRESSGQVTFEISVPGSEGVLTQIVKQVNPTPSQITRYVLLDALGSSGIVLDGTGNVMERRFYEPFGQETQADGTPVTNTPSAYISQLTRGFTGHQMEPELGLINMNGRLYDVKAGFLQADPILGSGQRANRYSYVMNSPMNFRDPSGHDPSCAGSTIACVTGSTHAGAGTGGQPGGIGNVPDSGKGGSSDGSTQRELDAQLNQQNAAQADYANSQIQAAYQGTGYSYTPYNPYKTNSVGGIGVSNYSIIALDVLPGSGIDSGLIINTFAELGHDLDERCNNEMQRDQCEFYLKMTDQGCNVMASQITGRREVDGCTGYSLDEKRIYAAGLGMAGALVGDAMDGIMGPVARGIGESVPGPGLKTSAKVALDLDIDTTQPVRAPNIPTRIDEVIIGADSGRVYKTESPGLPHYHAKPDEPYIGQAAVAVERGIPEGQLKGVGTPIRSTDNPRLQIGEIDINTAIWVEVKGGKQSPVGQMIRMGSIQKEFPVVGFNPDLTNAQIRQMVRQKTPFPTPITNDVGVLITIINSWLDKSQ